MGVLNAIMDVRAEKLAYGHPLTIPGLVGWWDLGDPTKIFSDGGATPIVADDPIYQVNDKSGLNNHLIQATLGNRPLYKTNIVNGRSVARFDGLSDFIEAVHTADTSFTVFCVVQKRSVPSGTSQAIFSTVGGGAAQVMTNTAFHATTYAWYRNQAAAGVAIPGTATSWNLLAFRVNSAASLDCYANGGTPTNLDPDDAITTNAGIAFGGGDVGNPGDVDLVEATVHNSALTAAAMNALGLYLTSRAGITWTTVL